MNALKDYVEWKLTHSDKAAEAEGYPLVLENCKKNKKMKDLKVYGNSVQDGTPSPENPVEVQSVGEKSKNLFHSGCKVTASWNINKVIVTDNSISGKILAENSSGYTRLIVDSAKKYAGKTIYLSFVSHTPYVFTPYTGLLVCDSNKNIVAEANTTQAWEDGFYSYIDVPGDVSETDTLDLRMYLKNGIIGEIIEITDVMVCEGSEPLPYAPYGKYSIPIVQKGNVYDAKTYPMTKGCYVNGSSITGGIVEGWAKYAATVVYIPCAELRQKTITINHTGGNTPGVCFYDDELSFISGVPNKNGTSITTVVPDNASYYRFSILVEYIDKATVYVEQSIHNVFLDAPLADGEVLDVKEHIPLPMLTSKTTVFTVDSEVEPSNMYGKYIK